jgi:hypothetical protein
LRICSIVAVATALLAATPALAQTACPQERAIYTEKDNGYLLKFRTPDPWEAAANVSAILELEFPDGERMWGWTWMPNGTSWNQANLLHGCKLPGPIDDKTGDPLPGSTDEELAACEVWEGVIYQLTGNDIDYLPFREDPAAPVILLTNVGPVIRYSGHVLSPGDEPHDVFTLSGCTE